MAISFRNYKESMFVKKTHPQLILINAQNGGVGQITDVKPYSNAFLKAKYKGEEVYLIHAHRDTSLEYFAQLGYNNHVMQIAKSQCAVFGNNRPIGNDRKEILKRFDTLLPSYVSSFGYAKNYVDHIVKGVLYNSQVKFVFVCFCAPKPCHVNSWINYIINQIEMISSNK